MFAAWFMAVLGIAGAYSPDRPPPERPPADQAAALLFRPIDQSIRPQPPLADPRAQRLLAAKLKVVCGLTMKQVDPAIDPRISVKLPDNRVHVKIRRIEPKVCRDSR